MSAIDITLLEASTINVCARHEYFAVDKLYAAKHIVSADNSHSILLATCFFSLENRFSNSQNASRGVLVQEQDTAQSNTLTQKTEYPQLSPWWWSDLVPEGPPAH